MGGFDATSAQRTSVIALALMVCVGCSDGTTGYRPPGDASVDSGRDAPGAQQAAEPASTTVPSTAGDPLLLLGDDPGLLHGLPDVLETEIVAASGLRVAYTAAGQREAIDPLYIEAQWQYLQTCTGVTAAAPLVIIVDGAVLPFVATDDVIRSIDGKGIATASVTAAGTLVQVGAADFDGSLGTPGFGLRAMFGRSLWLGASLAERDYPFSCALRDPTVEPGAGTGP